MIRAASGGHRHADYEARLNPSAQGRVGEGPDHQIVGPNDRARFQHRWRLLACCLLLKSRHERQKPQGEPPVARLNFLASSLNNRLLVFVSICFIVSKAISYKPRLANEGIYPAKQFVRGVSGMKQFVRGQIICPPLYPWTKYLSADKYFVRSL